ncbi:MAG TPA: hypothetical protein VNI61_00270 [Gemmatimonadales bacterium]|nr:hypothetical protein [Gemmatimonadales bacterium]
MRRLGLVFAAAVALYLPTARYGFVQDDRAIVAANPAAHSVSAALRAFDDPYWPPPSEAGLYRPLTVLSFAVDWQLSGGRAGWLHLMNALWHGLVTVLVTLVLARWLPHPGALAAGLIFGLHPVHVEAVAGLVGRADLLAGAGVLGAVLLARRRWWIAALLCAGLAMLSKEHGVIAGVAILLDDWLESGGRPRYPAGFYLGALGLTAGYLGLWFEVGRPALAAVAPPFVGASVPERLGLAFSAAWRGATLLVWPVDLSADYNPQVIPLPEGATLPVLLGAVTLLAVGAGAWLLRRRGPAVAWALMVAALAYLPSSNLLFPSGVVLAERALYLPVLVPAAAVGVAMGSAWDRGRRRAAGGLLVALCLLLGWRSLDRLPVWRDNKTFLTTLLEEHPESYRAHASAAAVLAGMGDTVGARREYQRADSLFPADPHLAAARALYLLSLGDTVEVASLLARARERLPEERVALRAEFLLWLERERLDRAAALADTAVARHGSELGWYRAVLQRVVDSLRAAR